MRKQLAFFATAAWCGFIGVLVGIIVAEWIIHLTA